MTFPLPKPPAKMQKKLSTVELNKKLADAFQQFQVAIQRDDFAQAYSKILPAHQLLPQHPKILMDLAYTELKLKKLDLAYTHYLKAIKYSGADVDPNIYDGLTEVCYFLEKHDEYVKNGQLAIERKKKLTAQEPVIQQIDSVPEAFHAANPKENIIAFSLFGNLPRYCETSIINVDLAKQIYPEWTCRFYVDATVTEVVKDRLRQRGAEVVEVTAAQQQLSGLFWRFLVMDDPQAKRFLIRDADSLVSYREKAAVDAWLQSEKWFHNMHDFYTHTELVLAGMWGGCHGVFRNVEQHIRDFIATGRFLNTRVMDQHYLRYAIWPTLCQSLMTHDSQGFDVLGLPFPAADQHTDFEDLSQFHVGMNDGSAQVQASVTVPNAAEVDWILSDEQQQPVCRYRAQVRDHQKIHLELPRSYARKIENKQWKLLMYAIENTD